MAGSCSLIRIVVWKICQARIDVSIDLNESGSPEERSNVRLQVRSNRSSIQWNLLVHVDD